MRLIVTGGAGFIGSAFVRYMMGRDDTEALMVFDAMTYAADMMRLESVIGDKRFSFFKGDIRSSKDVDDAISSFHPDTIVNFAAESHVDRSIASPSLFLETNVLGTGVLMDAALDAGVRRFHQVSTDEVYGDLPIDSHGRFNEDAPLRPSSPYSASKAAADLLVLSYVRTYGLQATISRCTNNYGPFQHEEKLIPMTVAKAMRNERIPVYGDGSNVREWIHADDHSKALEAIIRNGRTGEIYNIGTGMEIANIALIRMILRFLGRSEDLIGFVPDRPGHDRRYALDAGKLQRELGVSFSGDDFEERLRETVMGLSCKTSSTSF